MRDKANKILTLLNTVVEEFSDDDVVIAKRIFLNERKLNVIMERSIPSIEGLNYAINKTIKSDITALGNKCIFISRVTKRLNDIFVSIDGTYLNVSNELNDLFLLSLKLSNKVLQADRIRDANIVLMLDITISIISACIEANRRAHTG